MLFRKALMTDHFSEGLEIAREQARRAVHELLRQDAHLDGKLASEKPVPLSASDTAGTADSRRHLTVSLTEIYALRNSRFWKFMPTYAPEKGDTVTCPDQPPQWPSGAVWRIMQVREDGKIEYTEFMADDEARMHVAPLAELQGRGMRPASEAERRRAAAARDSRRREDSNEADKR